MWWGWIPPLPYPLPFISYKTKYKFTTTVLRSARGACNTLEKHSYKIATKNVRRKSRFGQQLETLLLHGRPLAPTSPPSSSLHPHPPTLREMERDRESKETVITRDIRRSANWTTCSHCNRTQVPLCIKRFSRSASSAAVSKPKNQTNKHQLELHTTGDARRYIIAKRISYWATSGWLYMNNNLGSDHPLPTPTVLESRIATVQITSIPYRRTINWRTTYERRVVVKLQQIW